MKNEKSPSTEQADDTSEASPLTPSHIVTPNTVSTTDQITDKDGAIHSGGGSPSSPVSTLPWSTADDALDSPTVLQGDADILETPEEKRLRRQSHVIIYFTAFLMSLGFSIVLTSVWPYLKQLDSTATKVFYGIVIAINPLGQFMLAPFFGAISNYMGTNRPTFIVSVLLFVVGNVMYALLRLFGDVAGYLMLVSRLIIGMGSANVALCRSYLAASTTLAERSTAMAYASAAQSMGLILGPAIQTALAVAIPASASLTRGSGSGDGNDIMHNITAVAAAPWYEPVWDLYTAAGWLAAVFGLINVFMFAPGLYQEVNISEREAHLMRKRGSNPITDEKYPKPDYLAIVVILINFFFILFIYVLLETILVPMTKDLYGWTSEYAIKSVGLGLSCLGILAFIMFFLCGFFCKLMDERKVYIILGLLPLIVGMFIHIPMGSNYAMMQNCSTANNLTEMTTVATMVIAPNTSSILMNKVESNRFFRSADQLQFGGSELNSDIILNFASNNLPALSRVRRFALDDPEGDCGALGCPNNQEWCRYVPIIELPQLIAGNLVAVIGYPIAFAMSSSLFSKMIGPKSQGLWMGLFTSTGSLSRMTGPIFVTSIYSQLGTRWTFSILICVLCFTVLLSCIFYKRLVPMDISKQSIEKESLRNPNAETEEI